MPPITNVNIVGKIFFKSIFSDLAIAKTVSPRGQRVKEIENYVYHVLPYVRFCSFKSRNYKVSYTKKEFLWYLRGDAFDTSICDHASMWKSLVNSDGSINSNYGQYIFSSVTTPSQFDVALNTLRKDKDSRRASIVILNRQHLNMITNDVPCTYALNFRIRDNALNMTVHMRSQDAIFGMGNDLPIFSFVQEMMLESLKETYPDLTMGIYTHFADSFHVYEKHFNMIDQIVNKNDEFDEIECPRISGSEEVKFLRKLDFTDVPSEYKFTKWLLDN